MIDQDNFTTLLESLGFSQNKSTYTKAIGTTPSASQTEAKGKASKSINQSNSNATVRSHER